MSQPIEVDTQIAEPTDESALSEPFGESIVQSEHDRLSGAEESR